MKRISLLQWIGIILALIQLVVSVVFIVFIHKTGLIPSSYFILILFALVLLLALVLVSQLRVIPGIIGKIVSLIITIVLIVGCVYLYHTNHLMDQALTLETQIDNIDVYVRADDKAQSIADAKGYSFGVLKDTGRENDKKNTDQVIEQLNELYGQTIVPLEYDTVPKLIDALLDKKIGAVIINSGYIELLEETEQFADLSDQIRVLTSVQIESPIVDNTPAKKPKNENVFSVYISGIDRTGPITAKSRSDVNIIAFINTETRHILLLSTPRDYYVPLSISNGVKDKLTHAGIYGIDVSKETLEMLYDIDIDYYFRINFTGFVNVIDAIDGVSVYSDYDFGENPDGSYRFHKGYNLLNSEDALAFARDRYSFANNGGDRVRGSNQMAIIEGVIQKLTSSTLLKNYTSILSSLEGSFQTSVPRSLIADLVEQQLDDMSGWTVTNYSVDGSNSSNTTYSSSYKLYVMEPDMKTVKEAQKLIQDIMTETK